MNKESLKQKVCAAIDAHKDELIAFGEDIFAHPELGFKEFRTAGLVKDIYNKLNIPFQSEVARTGVIGELTGKSSDITVAVLGELDAVLNYDHPKCDAQTGAVHACGHNAMITSLVGVAYGLVESGVMEQLDGRVKLMAVPAEEFVELEYRQKLQNENEIEFMGGKQEFIRLGAFDDVDMAMMMHLTTEPEGRHCTVGASSNGFFGKTVRYVGKEAHAGGAPHAGVNALNAAMMGLMGIHANRETFKDADAIRVHPIITKGGDLVNIVPADVRMETYVRGRSLDAIIDANKKVNRALKAGAMAVGADVEITEIPGYLPLMQNPVMTEHFSANMKNLIGEAHVTVGTAGGGSTDMGDVSTIMPAIHPTPTGVIGHAHARDYEFVDMEMAYVIPAKALAMTVVDLLFDQAVEAKAVKENFKPQMTKQEYLDMWKDVLGK